MEHDVLYYTLFRGYDQILHLFNIPIVIKSIIASSSYVLKIIKGRRQRTRDNGNKYAMSESDSISTIITIVITNIIGCS